MRIIIVAILFGIAAALITVWQFNEHAIEQRLERARQIKIARLDTEIKEAQTEADQARARLDRQISKPAELQQSLSPEGINVQIELLQNAMLNYRRKSDRLESLIETRAKIEKK